MKKNMKEPGNGMELFSCENIFHIDYERSLSLYEKHANLIQKKHCYDNIWNLLLNQGITQSQKICIGYVKCDGLYIRHSFLLEEGQIIDPTIPRKNQEYIIVAAFTRECFISHVAASYSADLIHDKEFGAMEEAFVTACRKHQIFCIG